jgi:glycerol-3-phosphate acyltransferase PlsY
MLNDHTIVHFALAFVLGLISGVIPFSYILGRCKGVDITKVGSKNIGATNLGRNCGPVFFIVGFLLDGLKGLIPVLVAPLLALPPMAAGAGAIIGHIGNPFFGFKGGKGVSTIIGVALGLVPYAFLIAMGVWIVLYLLTLVVSVASLGLAIVLPIAAFLLNNGSLIDRLFLVVLCSVIIIAHHGNILRIIKGTEPRTKLWEKR